MARAKVIHSEDAVMIKFEGNKNNPEPSTGIIKFPGGHVEVSRCTDGSYWAHIAVVDPVNIVETRADLAGPLPAEIRPVQDIPHGQQINHLALHIANTVAHFNPNA